MSKIYTTKTLIIGSGAAGYTAAIYAARANLQPILITGMQPGGQLTITTDVENYPGFATAVQGPELMEQMRQQTANAGATIILDEISNINTNKYPFECISTFNDKYIAYSIIIATGAQAKWLGIKSEELFKGRGVSACATCDGAFFKDKHVAVIGGGNTAVEEAIYLTKYSQKVFLIHRRDTLKAEAIMQDRLFNNKKIQVIWNSTLEEILGEQNVSAIKIKSIKDSNISIINVQGVFIAIGHSPNTKILRDTKINLDNDGYVITYNSSTATSCPGIFAAGDVQDKIYRQAVVAAGTGCMAAIDAEKFLSTQNI
ncbi:thioredoxin-disulfide reductase [Neoehrlichia mikurensis]|uniref:Thioredoxin reductase n=1 Tax=Neoehrlichia mikurensis TaxID=89586 RepID=A0A9Q9BZC7_9RICK|nr:thioredoxin-disulfide reductase [Neoehrlichia mikurensis]QXK92029.1 thioredoxin-disulfide reductase [Neoehrlichia mikurensis]QXK92487.1 thioredoxin-disulfide reductase [Neoehrlichia mikurensis]QXK93722.1 thioredoxin-disulfide reductase [Neoehrlichia mikurensis]UTO55305.1 thioredoxin-disulfide reductase [Neoehrlichia mikurensis]UTO56225.1 thioredoxin-disulfide reductase [Neoehrlichia mikurensis]